MVQLSCVYFKPVSNGSPSKLDDNLVKFDKLLFWPGFFSKFHYLSVKYTSKVMLHKIGIAVRNPKLLPFTLFSKREQRFKLYLKRQKKFIGYLKVYPL